MGLNFEDLLAINTMVTDGRWFGLFFREIFEVQNSTPERIDAYIRLLTPFFNTRLLL
jgi:hypothetical protein